jgi:3-hydroxyisobutyrate dehydrogenase
MKLKRALSQKMKPAREREESMQIGFIGIGVMGRPMTLNLLKAGHEVTVYARHPDKAAVQEVLHAGAKLAPSARTLANASEVIITMVTDSAQVEEIVTGPQGILEGAHEGLVIIDMSTIAPAMTRKLAEIAANKGVHFLDAPVSGGPSGAEKGTLTIMIGGEQSVFERVRPVLEVMGKKEGIIYVGPSGAGEIVKVINNMITGTIIAATAEGMVLGVKAGIDPETLTKIISISTGASGPLSNLFPLRAFKGNFQPGFMTNLQVKDLGLALDLAAENQTPVPMTTRAYHLYEVTCSSGYGLDDCTSVIRIFEQAAGVEVRIKEEK